jgi:DNA-binding XRE family transcriptional regulator
MTSRTGRADVRPAPVSDATVATNAVLRAAGRLGLSNKALARIIGVSEATVSRMGAGSYVLAPGEKPFELALLLVRLFRSLDAIAGGDEAVSKAWLRNENAALGGTPVTLVESVSGLVHVLGYLDARRALA